MDKAITHHTQPADDLVKQSGKTHFADDDTIAYIARLEAEIALAREALEAIHKAAKHNASTWGVWIKDMCQKYLASLTTGNAVQQIEARALRAGAEHCDYMRYASNQECAEALRKLAEQKEKGAK